MKVNLTSEEAAPVRNLEVLPSGKYLCNITDGSLEVVKPGKKNTGKDYWKLTFVIQDGPHAGRNIISTVMLFAGALYSFSGLMQALGYEVVPGEIDVPPLDEIIGRTVIVRGIKKPAITMEGGDLPERFEVKGYHTPPAKKAVDSSLLP